jgi:hypothetical protein
VYGAVATTTYEDTQVAPLSLACHPSSRSRPAAAFNCHAAICQQLVTDALPQDTQHMCRSVAGTHVVPTWGGHPLAMQQPTLPQHQAGASNSHQAGASNTDYPHLVRQVKPPLPTGSGTRPTGGTTAPPQPSSRPGIPHLRTPPFKNYLVRGDQLPYPCACESTWSLRWLTQLGLHAMQPTCPPYPTCQFCTLTAPGSVPVPACVLGVPHCASLALCVLALVLCSTISCSGLVPLGKPSVAALASLLALRLHLLLMHCPCAFTDKAQCVKPIPHVITTTSAPCSP